MRKISDVIEWRSGLDGPSGLISAPMSSGRSGERAEEVYRNVGKV